MELHVSLLLLSAYCFLVADGLGTKEVVKSHAVVHLKAEDESTETTTKDSKESNERDSRGLLKKLSFLAGLKAGGGLVSSSGTLAASNSLRIFGKVMNTALSVSYGHVDDIDQLPEVQADPTSSSEKVRDEKDTRSKLSAARQGFIKQHNSQVSRINHKFLRSDPVSPV